MSCTRIIIFAHVSSRVPNQVHRAGERGSLLIGVDASGDALLLLTTLFVLNLRVHQLATMPVSTSSRSSTAYTTLTSTPTPSRSHPSWPTSPQSVHSYSPTVTSAGQVAKMNVVTRVVVEGKAKQGQDGASIKMYMKVSLRNSR